MNAANARHAGNELGELAIRVITVAIWQHVAAILTIAFMKKSQLITGAKNMDANEYQQQASRTLIDQPDAEYTGFELMMVWNAIGLAGEAGEVADTIKKAVFHRHGLDRNELIKELGDVLWYVAALCTKIDASMGYVMQQNIDKLKKRYPAGYSAEASINRE